MIKEWTDDDELSLKEMDGSSKEDTLENIENFEINSEIVSDTFWRLYQKVEQCKDPRYGNQTYLDKLSSSVKRFILENIRIIE